MTNENISISNDDTAEGPNATGNQKACKIVYIRRTPFSGCARGRRDKGGIARPPPIAGTSSRQENDVGEIIGPSTLWPSLTTGDSTAEASMPFDWAGAFDLARTFVVKLTF